MTDNGGRTYPREAAIKQGTVTLRKAKKSDRDGLLAMARALPQHDLMFLRRDLTEPAVVEEWLADSRLTILLAELGGEVVGYASIERASTPWQAHVAELRITVSEYLRNRGLGRLLTQEAFAYALGSGVEKMVAQMTLDQKGAIQVFEEMGFRPEALLKDHVRDRNGTKHDLLMLSHDVARFEATHAAYGVATALQS